MRAFLLLTLAVALGCASDHCTAANCAALNSCGFRLEADDDHICRSKRLRPPIPLDFEGCVQACEGTGQGGLLQCFSGYAARCSANAAAGGAAAFAACVKSPPRSYLKSCTDSCRTARSNCEAGCSSTSWSDCVSCAADCGIAAVACEAACPPG